MQLAQHLRGRENNLNLLRILAASAVILSHSYVLVTGQFSEEPLRETLGMSLGDIAVDLFFVISGLLVTGSILKRGHLGIYFLARIRRIYPGLIVMLLLINIPIGLWMTSHSWQEYLTSPGLRASFLHNTLLILPAWTGLPGVFTDAPWPHSANGSLWTLTYEIRLYLWLGACWAISRLFRSKSLQAFHILAAFTWITAVIFFFTAAHGRGGDPVPRLVMMFSAGMLLQVYKESIKLQWKFFFITVFAMLLASTNEDFFRPVYGLLAPYLFVCIAYLPGGFLRSYNRAGDYSFGLYIYAFPIQQILVQLRPSDPPIINAINSLLLTLVPAFLSWHFVESRCIQHSSTPQIK